MENNSSFIKFRFLLFILVFVVAIQGYFIYDLKTKNVSNNNSTKQTSSVELLANEQIPQQNDKKNQEVVNTKTNNKIEHDNKTKQIKKVDQIKKQNNSNIVQYDPFFEIRKMQEQMIREFNSFNSIFANDPFFKNSFDHMNFAPLSDLKDQKDKYVITVEIPGIKEKNIKIDTKDHLLSISATNEKSNEKKDENYIQKERYMQSFKRVFTLPNDANMDKLTTKYSNGVLSINIPKNKPNTQK
jgi:HSP20 family protein